MRYVRFAAAGLFLTTVLVLGQEPQDSSSDKPSPFGLQMGMSKEQLGSIQKEISPFKFQLTQVSKPHPDLETFVVTATPKAGLCFIRALSPDYKTGKDGAILRSRFDAMKSQIEGIYGTPNVLDSLNSGTKGDWMTALLNKDRQLLARWSAVEDKLPMKPTITKIYVGAFANSSESGYLAVEYYFENYDQCQAELREPPAEVLSLQ